MSTDNATTGGRAPRSVLVNGRKVCYRKLGKHGCSLMLCVPGVFVYELRVFRGADFELTLDDDGGGFHARVLNRGRIKPAPPANVHGVSEVPR